MFPLFSAGGNVSLCKEKIHDLCLSWSHAFNSSWFNHRNYLKWANVSFLPAATKVWSRLCFYTCLWFCSRGGLRAGRTPRTGRTPPGRENPPPRQGGPPSREEPPSPDQADTPLDQADTPPDQAEPPTDQADTPPGPGRAPPGPGRPPPGKQTPEYGLRAARYASYWNAFLFVANVIFFSGGDYMFYCETVFGSQDQEVNVISATEKCNILPKCNIHCLISVFSLRVWCHSPIRASN